MIAVLRRCFATAASAVLVVVFVGEAGGATITAGPDGTHATIQAAIGAAMATAGDDEVRVQSGHWIERVAFNHTVSERTDISGGWNADFDVQTADPAATVIDGDLAGRTWRSDTYSGTVTVRNLTFTRGRYDFSANVRLAAYGDTVIELSDCGISHGESLTPEQNVGHSGGIEATALNTSMMRVERCRIHDNTLSAPGGQARGGGLSAAAVGGASLVLADLEIVDNSVLASGAVAGGLDVTASGQATVQILDSIIAGNSVGGDSSVLGSGVVISLTAPAADVASVEFRRNLVHGNTSDAGLPTVQVGAIAFDGYVLSLGDSQITGSPVDGGVSCQQYGTGVCNLVNLTLADNAAADLSVYGTVAVSNTLADTTDSSVAGAVNSLLDTDPGYVDRTTGDYRLPLSSPAIGAGTLTPAGGLGEFDLDGNPRVIGIGVDIGAYEADDPRIFVDGFE